MSHFTRVRTRLCNIDTVKKALEELGFTVAEGAVRGYGGQRAQADLVVRMGDAYDIGFQQSGDEVVMVADFWGLSVDRAEFLKQVSQKYAYITVLERSQSQGWDVMSEETLPDGSVRLVMQRWQ